MPDFKARDTGAGSAASGGSVDADNIAGQDVQRVDVHVGGGRKTDSLERTTGMIVARLNGIDDQIARLSEAQAFYWNDAKRERRNLHKMIVGNGEPGFGEQMRSIKAENRRFRFEVRTMVIVIMLWCVVLTMIYIGVAQCCIH